VQGIRPGLQRAKKQHRERVLTALAVAAGASKVTYRQVLQLFDSGNGSTSFVLFKRGNNGNKGAGSRHNLRLFPFYHAHNNEQRQQGSRLKTQPPPLPFLPRPQQRTTATREQAQDTTSASSLATTPTTTASALQPSAPAINIITNHPPSLPGEAPSIQTFHRNGSPVPPLRLSLSHTFHNSPTKRTVSTLKTRLTTGLSVDPYFSFGELK
jgi:hypothetical protein